MLPARETALAYKPMRVLQGVRSKGWFPLRAAQQRDAPKSSFPFGFSPESALAALRTLRIDHYSLRHAPCHHPILG
jgi:hypothetical protein